MDLFSLGADDARLFEAMVGGSPTNIAIASRRLGLRSVAFTGVGDDPVGEFVLDYLQAEGVATEWVQRVSGKLTSLALLGVKSASSVPLSFYRTDPADIHLTLEDAATLPFAGTRAVLVSGNALSRGSSADAAAFCAAEAARRDLDVFMDLDLRPTEWSAPDAFGAAIRPVLADVDVLIGTEEELWALLSDRPEIVFEGDEMPSQARPGLAIAIDRLVTDGAGPGVVVLKQGERGVKLHGPAEHPIEVAGYPVEVVNTVGAGDAFAAGLITRRLARDAWHTAASFANACGAIVVTRHGCASAFPFLAEVEAFLAAHDSGAVAHG